MRALKEGPSPVVLTVVRGEPPPPPTRRRTASQNGMLLALLMVLLAAAYVRYEPAITEALEARQRGELPKWLTKGRPEGATPSRARTREDILEEAENAAAVRRLMEEEAALPPSPMRKLLTEDPSGNNWGEPLDPSSPQGRAAAAREQKAKQPIEQLEISHEESIGKRRFALGGDGMPMDPDALRSALRKDKARMARIRKEMPEWATVIEGEADGSYDRRAFVGLMREDRMARRYGRWNQQTVTLDHIKPKAKEEA